MFTNTNRRKICLIFPLLLRQCPDLSNILRTTVIIVSNEVVTIINALYTRFLAILGYLSLYPVKIAPAKRKMASCLPSTRDESVQVKAVTLSAATLVIISLCVHFTLPASYYEEKSKMAPIFWVALVQFGTIAIIAIVGASITCAPWCKKHQKSKRKDCN